MTFSQIIIICLIYCKQKLADLLHLEGSICHVTFTKLLLCVWFATPAKYFNEHSSREGVSHNRLETAMPSGVVTNQSVAQQ